MCRLKKKPAKCFSKKYSQNKVTKKGYKEVSGERHQQAYASRKGVTTAILIANTANFKTESLAFLKVRE